MPRTICLTSASGCADVSLMSLSFIALTRDQSVLDAFEEDDLLIFGRLTKRDNVDVIGGFSVHDGNRSAVQQAKRNESLFIVIEPVVLEGKCQARGNTGGGAQ